MDAIAKRMTEGYGMLAVEQGVRVPARVIGYTVARFGSQ